ncbi:uncharacterized protein TrAtP1_002044 [Trichoderma atroviride]|uniref:uncharacterized protein n=1 Tax=Hypocrea atroviridis TaxID=63577 RepID=UPI003318E58F|nr:hypothetical protein TrAtP1_002044 [Trichoderma atroviride]
MSGAAGFSSFSASSAASSRPPSQFRLQLERINARNGFGPLTSAPTSSKRRCANLQPTSQTQLSRATTLKAKAPSSLLRLSAAANRGISR